MKNFISAVILIGFCHNANATFTNYGDYIYDTISNLDWHNFTNTYNKSFDYISGQFGVGGEFEGWRYATYSEARNIYDGPNGYAYLGSDDWTVSLGALTLTNSSGDSYSSLHGLTSSIPYINSGFFDERRTFGVNDGIRNTETSLTESTSNLTIGSWLVRDSQHYTSVSEGTSLYLLSFGLIALLGLQRKRKPFS